MNFIEVLLNINSSKEVEIPQEDVEQVMASVEDPPKSARAIAEDRINFYTELPEPISNPHSDTQPELDAAQEALKALVSAGHVPAAIALVADQGADIETRYNVGLQAFENHITMLKGDLPSTQVFRDPVARRQAERDFAVFQAAREKALLEINSRSTEEVTNGPTNLLEESDDAEDEVFLLTGE